MALPMGFIPDNVGTTPAGFIPDGFVPDTPATPMPIEPSLPPTANPRFSFAAGPSGIGSGLAQNIQGVPAPTGVLPRMESLYTKGMAGVAGLGNLMPLQAPQGTGEELVQGLGSITALAPTLSGIGAGVTRLAPALKAPGILPSAIRGGLELGIHGGYTGGMENGPEGIIPGAVQGAGTGALFGGIGSAGMGATRGIVDKFLPIPKVVRNGGKLFTQSGKEIGVDTLRKLASIQDIAGITGSVLTGGASGALISGGNVAETLLGGLLPLLHGLSYGKVSKIGVTEDPARVEARGVRTEQESFNNGMKAITDTIHASAEVKLAEKIDQRDKRRVEAYIGTKLSKMPGAQPAGVSPETMSLDIGKDAKVALQLAEDFTRKGDVEAAAMWMKHADDLISQMPMAEIANSQRFLNPTPEVQSAIESLRKGEIGKSNMANLASSLGVDYSVKSYPITKKQIYHINGETYDKGGAAKELVKLFDEGVKRYSHEGKTAGVEALREMQGYKDVSDEVLKQEAYNEAIQELIQASNQVGLAKEPTPQELGDVDPHPLVPLQTKMEIEQNATGLVNLMAQDQQKTGNAHTVKKGALGFLDKIRFMSRFDSFFGKASTWWHDNFVTPILTGEVTINHQLNSRMDKLVDDLKLAGMDVTKHPIFGTRNYNKKQSLRLLKYHLSVQSDAKLASQGVTAADAKVIRTEVAKYSPEEINTFIKSKAILKNLFDEIFPEMQKFYKEKGIELKYDDDYLPWLEDYASLRSTMGETANIAFADLMRKPGELSWKHVGKKHGLPPNMLDPLAAAKKYLQDTYSKQVYDPMVQKLRYTARSFDKKVNPNTKLARHDIAKLFDQMADTLEGKIIENSLDDAIKTTLPGKVLSNLTGTFVNQVLLSFDVGLRQILSAPAMATLESSGSGIKPPITIAKEIALALNPRTHTLALNYSKVLQSRMYGDSSSYNKTENLPQRFYGNFISFMDRAMVVATFNMSYKYYAPKVGHERAISLADRDAGRVNGVFNRVIKPNVLNGAFWKVAAPLQTSLFSSFHSVSNDVLLNPKMSKGEKAARLGTYFAIGVMSRYLLSFISAANGDPTQNLPTAEIQEALVDGIPVVGSVVRTGGPGIVGSITSLYKSSRSLPEKAIQGASMFSPIPGSYALYRTFKSIQSLMDDGVLKDKNDKIIRQFDTSDPLEVGRALAFGVYKTWGVSQGSREEYPPTIEKWVKNISENL